MPNGRSIVLERQPGADAAGYAGLEDEVDNHWGEFSKLLPYRRCWLSEPSLVQGPTPIAMTVRSSRLCGTEPGIALNQTGQHVVRRSLNIQPTLTIRPGFPVRVIVNRDLVLEPYRG